MKNIYLEITNACNLKCSFCHGTSRNSKFMTEEEFEAITDKLTGKADYLFFHILGEPLLHPLLPAFVKRAREKGFKPCITTNGTLLKDRMDELVQSNPFRCSISLHSMEANGVFAKKEYLDSCIEFAEKASENGTYVALRLWNTGGLEEGNSEIIARLHDAFPNSWEEKRSGWRMADKIFLEKGEKFDWPDLNAKDYGEKIFCYGMRNQLGILVDGTVVPCCLDADGTVNLGNIFKSSLEEIASSPRAKAISDGFSKKFASEELCRHCGYAALKKMH